MTERSVNRAFRICDLPSDERPRERLLRLGPAALSNEELLALLLRTGIRGESALDRARSLLATRGGLAGLAGISTEELVDRAGHRAHARRRDRRGDRDRAAAARPRRSRAAIS